MNGTSRDLAYQEIAYYADHINAIRSDGTYVARLGLICTVFMRGSGKLPISDKIFQCFDRFFKEFGEHLQSQFHSLSGRTFSGLRADSLQKTREKLRKLVASGDYYDWSVQSEKKAAFAPEYGIETLTTHPIAHESHLGYLKLILPWRILETPEGEQQFMDWVRYLCEELDIEHGYAGLSCVLPYDRHEYQPYDFQTTRYYSGLMEDSAPHMEKMELMDGIKGVNWLTLLDPMYIGKLGGKEKLKKALQLPGVDVSETANGRFIIKAGLLPAVGAPEKGHPPEYVAVNRVLKPVRVPLGLIVQFHTVMDNAVAFTRQTTDEWLTRFDDPEPEAPKPLPPQAAPDNARCDGGHVCPQDGVWWSPAVPPNESGARRFKKGDTMPNYPLSKYGSTIWYWQSK